jgi:hypothetical protein
MRTMVIVVTLMALALVPTIVGADSGEPVRPKDVTVNLRVLEFADLWHTADEITLTVSDADHRAYFGQEVSMYLSSNVAVNIELGVELGKEWPEEVSFEILTNADGDWWSTESQEGSDSTRRWLLSWAKRPGLGTGSIKTIKTEFGQDEDNASRWFSAHENTALHYADGPLPSTEEPVPIFSFDKPVNPTEDGNRFSNLYLVRSYGEIPPPLLDGKEPSLTCCYTVAEYNK